MRKRAALCVGWLLLATIIAQGQDTSTWSCSEELTKSEGDNHRIRVSTGVSERMIDKKVLPDTRDLKRSRVDSTVIVRVLIDKKGVVRCADAVQGDASLVQRSIDAAQRWKFRPFTLNGEPIIVETPIEFVFKKGSVKAR
jgi:hypothetical protein